MAFTVKLNFMDEYGRKTSRSFGNTSALIADVLTDLATLAPLFEAVIQGGMLGATISIADKSDAFVATSPSNIDENASLQVVGGDGYNYDFDLPMPIAALRLAGGSIDTANAALVSLMAQWAVGAKWRVNLRSPTDIVSVTKGTLDK